MALCCFTLVILILVSFSSLEANEVGLNYSAISKEVKILYFINIKIEQKPYTAGYYWLGIAHSFIRYPKTV